jgi:hypothetical protein
VRNLDPDQVFAITHKLKLPILQYKVARGRHSLGTFDPNPKLSPWLVGGCRFLGVFVPTCWRNPRETDYEDLSTQQRRRIRHLVRYFAYPYYQAVTNGNAAIARLVIDHGATVHAADRNGWTVLHAASRHGHLV